MGRSGVTQRIGDRTFPFCCPGCSQVFLLLFHRPEGPPENFRETPLYRACLESGILPRGPADPADEKGLTPSLPDAPPYPGLALELRVDGMWCPACSWLIEEALRRTRGILEPRVSFFGDRVELKYLPHLLSPEGIIQKIARLGYRASFPLEGEGLARERKDLLVRLGVSAILCCNIMMISFALYLGFFSALPAEGIAYLSYPLWLMATPALFWGGLPLLRKGLAGLFYRRPTMESLIAIGSTAAYAYSVYRMAQGSLHLYFDTASMLITLALLGRYLEMHAREKAAAGIDDLSRLARQKVRLFRPEGESWVSSGAAAVGDLFRVLKGERVPLDGVIQEGRGEMDESILTGESRPVSKGPGEEARAGALLLRGEMKIRAVRVGRESSLEQMIALMREALEKKNPAERMADRVTRWFVPAILAIAAATGVSLRLSGAPGDEVLLRTLTVLVIACPCALGIATPIVKLVSVGLAKSKGILVRDPGALETAKNLEVMVFDKTGTLTEGAFSLQGVIPSGGMDPDSVLSLVASVEAPSPHFLAGEIRRKAEERRLPLEKVEDFENLEGLGVSGLVGGRKIFVGSRRLMAREGLQSGTAQEEKARGAEALGMTVIFAGWEGKVRALILFGDSLRPGVPEMIRSLHARGIATWLVSGDSRETTKAVACRCGIPRFRGETLPAEKAELIGSLQVKGQRVGMVGDGINDGPALARADVGIALGAGSDLIRGASHLTLLTPDPGRVPGVLELSAATVRTIRQNLFLSFLYNAVGIPLAVSGWLNPLVAVVAMFASSLTVTGNALRISRRGRF